MEGVKPSQLGKLGFPRFWTFGERSIESGKIGSKPQELGVWGQTQISQTAYFYFIKD